MTSTLKGVRGVLRHSKCSNHGLRQQASAPWRKFPYPDIKIEPAKADSIFMAAVGGRASNFHVRSVHQAISSA